MIIGCPEIIHFHALQRINCSKKATTTFAGAISGVSNQPLFLNATNIPCLKNKKAIPFDGLKKWVGSVASVVSKNNPHKMIAIKDDAREKTYVNSVDGHTVTRHANRLIECVPLHGDALVLSFAKGLHSAILLNDNNTIKYFSFFAHDGNEHHGIEKCREELVDDMLAYNDTLFTGINGGKRTCEIPLSRKNNFQKIKIENVDKVINAWRANTTKFKFITNNCSYPASMMIREGTEENIKFKHKRRLQMPYNTFNMARELAKYQQKQSVK